MLTREGTLSARTLAALREAMARGVLVVLASGRMVEAMRNLAEEIPVNAPLIAFNGALAWDLREGRAAARFPLACEDAKAICRMAEERGLHIQAYPDGGYFYERANEFSRYYEEKLHYPGKALGIKMSEYITTDVNKLLIVAPEEACSQAIPEFQRAFEGKASFFRSRPVYIEIVHPSVNKGRALEAQAYPDGGYFYERANEFSRYYEEKLHYPGKALGIKMSEYITTDVNKLLIVAPEEACSQAIPEFQRAFEGKASFFRSRPVYIEIVHPSVNKGRALEALARSLNVPREQVIAFGDEDNDLSMLEYAGVGYAMDNAKPEFKAKADKIAPHFAQDGVAQVIEQLIREGEMDW